MKVISSIKNDQVKYLLELQEKSRTRRREGLFVAEGAHELQLLQQGGYRLRSLFFYPGLADQQVVEQTKHAFPQAEVTEISRDVFEKLAYRRSTGGVLALVEARPNRLGDLKLRRNNPLLLICEGVEKPGNLGALLRTADAARLDGLIVCDPKADFYNPNVIRSSVGCLFTQPVAAASSEETISWLKENGISVFATALTASKRYDMVDMHGPTAIVVGTEATGLTDTWLQASDQNIIIPMQGVNDSLNVSVAAAIALFEAQRQRNFVD